MAKESKEQSFALCIENKECEDLEKRKIYRVRPDDDAAREGYLRIAGMEKKRVIIIDASSSLDSVVETIFRNIKSRIDVQSYKG